MLFWWLTGLAGVGVASANSSRDAGSSGAAPGYTTQGHPSLATQSQMGANSDLFSHSATEQPLSDPATTAASQGINPAPLSLNPSNDTATQMQSKDVPTTIGEFWLH
jgi:hypothetical protein